MGVFFNQILDFFYPERLKCLICDADMMDDLSESYICSACLEKMFSGGKRCYQCDRPIEQVYSQLGIYQYKCKACQEHFHYFTRHITCTLYEDEMKRMLLGLKYKNRVEGVKAIVQAMSLRVSDAEFIKSVQYVMPVPIHWTRHMSRGFNQSRLIADEFSKDQALEVYDCLKRVKRTKKLKNLNKEARKSMMKDAIILDEKSKTVLSGKSVLLIDDIYTTGSTLDECSRVLYEAGVDKIYCMTFAMGR